LGTAFIFSHLCLAPLLLQLSDTYSSRRFFSLDSIAVLVA
jgi:hypothetical protein